MQLLNKPTKKGLEANDKLRGICSRQMPEVQLRMIQVCRVLACGCSILTLYLPHQPPHRPIVLKTKEFVVGKELFETGEELKATMPWVLENSNTNGK